MKPPQVDGVATVLTVYGIETSHLSGSIRALLVATVLTVYGIETCSQVNEERGHVRAGCNSTYRLRY